jgi:hypothetical protein
MKQILRIWTRKDQKFWSDPEPKKTFQIRIQAKIRYGTLVYTNEIYFTFSTLFARSSINWKLQPLPPISLYWGFLIPDQGRTQGGCTGCTCIPPPQPERLVMRKDEAVGNKKKIQVCLPKHNNKLDNNL